MVYDFNSRKAKIKKMTIDFFGSTLFLIVVLAVLVGTSFLIQTENRLIMLCVSVPIVSAIAIAFLICSIYELSIYRKIKDVDTTQTESVKLFCKKVKLLTYPSGRTGLRVVGVILTDDNGQKYINLFCLDHTYSEKKEIKKKLACELQVQKYCNSSVIIDLEKFL